MYKSEMWMQPCVFLNVPCPTPFCFFFFFFVRNASYGENDNINMSIDPNGSQNEQKSGTPIFSQNVDSNKNKGEKKIRMETKEKKGHYGCNNSMMFCLIAVCLQWGGMCWIITTMMMDSGGWLKWRQD